MSENLSGETDSITTGTTDRTEEIVVDGLLGSFINLTINRTDEDDGILDRDDEKDNIIILQPGINVVSEVPLPRPSNMHLHDPEVFESDSAKSDKVYDIENCRTENRYKEQEEKAKK